MENAIVQMIVDSLGASSTFFSYIMDSLGMIGQMWLAYIMIHVLFRFVIKPVFGSAGSDRASKKNAKSSQSGGEDK